jgi:hypothetical protein
VSLTGSGYRVAVIVHMVEAAMTNNPALIKTAEEILTRRIVVPSDR